MNTISGPLAAPAINPALERILLEKTVCSFDGSTQYAVKNAKFNAKFHARYDIFGKRKHDKDAPGTFTVIARGEIDYFVWVVVEPDPVCGNKLGFLITSKVLDQNNHDIEAMLLDVNRVLKKEGYVFVLAEDVAEILVLTLVAVSDNKKIIKGTGVRALIARPNITDKLNLERRVSTQGSTMVDILFNDDPIDGTNLINKIHDELANVGIKHIKYEVFDSDCNLTFQINVHPGQ